MGFLDTIKEAVGLQEKPYPEMEPEVKKHFEDAGLRQVETREVKGVQIPYYTYSGLSEPIDAYTLNVAMWQDQVQYFQERLKSPEGKLADYQTMIRRLDDYFVQRKGEYRRMEMALSVNGDELDKVREEYNRGLHVNFEEGDITEVALKEKMQKLAASKPDLPNYDTFVYSGNITDIDNMVAGEQHFDDLRVLQAKYKLMVDRLEDTEVDQITEKLDASKDALERAKREQKAFFKQK